MMEIGNLGCLPFCFLYKFKRVSKTRKLSLLEKGCALINIHKSPFLTYIIFYWSPLWLVWAGGPVSCFTGYTKKVTNYYIRLNDDLYKVGDTKNYTPK